MTDITIYFKGRDCYVRARPQDGGWVTKEREAKIKEIITDTHSWSHMLSFFAAASYSKFPILPSTTQHWIPELSVLSDPLIFRFLIFFLGPLNWWIAFFFLAVTGFSPNIYFSFLFITTFITHLSPNFKTSMPNIWIQKNICFWHFTIFLSHYSNTSWNITSSLKSL